MKKQKFRSFLAGFLAIMLITLNAPVIKIANAATSVTATVETVSASNVGQNISIPFHINDIGLCSSFGIKFDYDNTALQFTGWDFSGCPIPALALVKTTAADVSGGQKISVAYMSSSGLNLADDPDLSNLSGDQIVGKMKFTVLKAESTTVSVSATAGEATASTSVNNVSTPMTVNRVAGGLTINDNNPPAAPTVTGVTDGAVYGTSVSATWTTVSGVTYDAKITKGTGAAQAYTSGSTITGDGAYKLEVTATKTSNGLTAKTTINFTIDTVVPATPVIGGVANNAIYATAKTPTWTVAGTGVITTATLAQDGGAPQAYTSGTAISADGAYVLEVTATKVSNGLTAKASISFTIDKVAPPQPVIVGATEGGTYGVNVALTWSDPTGVTSTATLDTKAYTKGTPITVVGAHTLVVTATKTSNGLTSSATVHFTVSNDGPKDFTFNGAQNNGFYANDVTINWTTEAGVTYTSTYTKDSDPTVITYTSGSAITAEGTYVLSVVATKTSTNITLTKTITFTIDKQAPAAPIISGVAEGETYGKAVNPTWTTVSGVTFTATLKKDSGTPVSFTRGAAVSANGSYILEVTASKKNGLTAKSTVNFSIDTGIPNPVTVTGVVNNSIINLVDTTGAAATWTDATGTTSTATLDGADYTKGTQVTTLGKHELIVTTVKTLTGNKVDQKITFTIVPYKIVTTGTVTDGQDTITLGKSSAAPFTVGYKIDGTYGSNAVLVFVIKDANGVTQNVIKSKENLNNKVGIFVVNTPTSSANYTVEIMVVDKIGDANNNPDILAKSEAIQNK